MSRYVKTHENDTKISLINCLMSVFVFLKALSNSSLYLNVDYNTTIKILLDIIYILIFLGIVFLSWSQNQLLIAIPIGLFVAASSYMSRDAFLVATFLFLLALNGADYIRTVKTVFYTHIFSIVVILSLHFLEIFPDEVKSRGDVVRYSLGFRHVNTLGLYIFSACVMFCVLYYEKFRLKHAAFIVLATLLIYFSSDSQSSILCCAIMLFLVLLFKLCGDYLIKNKLVQILLLLFIPFCFVISAFLAKNYDQSNQTMALLNKLTTNRLYLGAQYYHSTQVTLFSTAFTLGDWYLDNSYLDLLLFNGLGPSLLFIGLSLVNMKKAIGDKNLAVIIGILTFGIFGLFEAAETYFWFNITMFYALCEHGTGAACDISPIRSQFEPIFKVKNVS